MPGKVFLREAHGLGSGEPCGAFLVVTAPAIPNFCQRFWRGNSADPYAKALGFASMSAAALGWELIDQTGRLAPAMCAALVAVQARKGGATVTPIGLALRSQ